MASKDVIESGGLSLPAASLKCVAQASIKNDEALVKVRALENPNLLAFYVEKILVTTEGNVALTKQDVDGTVKVILLSRANGTAVVEIPGEPITYGPKVVVSSNDLA